jgi:hypothetical protein
VYQIKEIYAKKLVLMTGKELGFSEKYRDNIKKEYVKFMMRDI